MVPGGSGKSRRLETKGLMSVLKRTMKRKEAHKHSTVLSSMSYVIVIG